LFSGEVPDSEAKPDLQVNQDKPVNPVPDSDATTKTETKNRAIENWMNRHMEQVGKIQ
jgi:hypothetical protein